MFHGGLFYEAGSDVGALVFVAVAIGAVGHGITQVLVCGGTYYFPQRLQLQIAYALWQPCCAFTGVARTLLVNQHCVKRSGTYFLYVKVLAGVDSVVFKQSLVDHMPIYRLTLP